MSFILDALKKSETDRQRQNGPALFEVRAAPPRNHLPAWAIGLGVLLAVNLVIVAWVLLRHSSSSDDREQASTTRPAQQPPASPASYTAQTQPYSYGPANPGPGGAPQGQPQQGQPWPQQQGAPQGGYQQSAPQQWNQQGGPQAGQGMSQGQGPQGGGMQQGANGGYGNPGYPPGGTAPSGQGMQPSLGNGPQTGGLTQQSGPNQGVPQGQTGGDVSGNPDDYAPAADAPPTRPFGNHVTRSGPGGVPLYADVAMTMHLPTLRLDLHVFASSPQERFVMVNMHKLHEGDLLPSEGVRVESITPDGAVLNHDGTRFLLVKE